MHPSRLACVSSEQIPGMHPVSGQDGGMSAMTGRRQRKHGGQLLALMQARVRPEVREKANIAAQAAGITLAGYLEQLVERDELDASGCPLWLTPASEAQEELPLKTA
jgi:hypothetical protein